MKKNLSITLVFSVLFYSTVFSQIIINQGDMPAVGDNIQTATDTLTPGITIGNAGVNQIWDFSNLTPDRTTTNNIVNPATTPAASTFPNANRAITQNMADYVYARVTAQRYELQGATGDLLGIGVNTTVVFNPVNEVYRFPTQYGGNYNGTWGFQVLTPFSDLPPALQQQINSSLPNGVTVSRLRTTFTSNYTDLIDGWGTTITPICSYNSLRQTRTENTTLLVEAEAFLGLIPLGWQQAINETGTNTSYNWLAKETKLPLVSVTFDTLGAVNSVTYSLIPPALDANFTASATSVCEGGSIDFSDATYGCPDSWAWSFPGGTPSSSNAENPTGIVYNTPGTYAVTLTVTRGATSNTETKNMYITVNAPPIASATNDTICLNETGALVASGGTTYLWNTGAVSATLNENPAVTTNYSVTVTDANNCSDTTSATIVVNPLPVADAGVNDTICPGQSGSLTAAGGVTYEWNTGTTNASLNISPSVTTNYTVIVTDINGCKDSDVATIVVLPAPVANAGPNDTICRNEIATLSGSGTGTFSWSNGATTAQINVSPATTTTYILTVTGANGCTAISPATVVVNQLPAKTLNNITICPGSTTVLDAGNPGATYVWSTGAITRTINVDADGDYSVTVTDSKGCVNSDTATITVSTSLSVILNDAEFCDGDSVTLDAGNPGSSYDWSTGDTTQTLTVFTSGIYSVTVIDAIGCEGQNSSTINVFSLPSVDAGLNDTICFGETGILNGSGSAGDYLWSNLATTLSTSDSPVQTTVYYLQVSDSNQCVASDSVWIVVNDLPAVDAGNNDTICFGETGALLATGDGDYLWNTGETTAGIFENPAATATYSVTVTGSNGCTASDNAIIIVNQLPIVSVIGNLGVCEGGSVTLTASGGIGYVWSTGDSTASITFTPDSFAVYSVTVTDANGCVNEDSASVTVFTNPTAFITGLDTAYCPNDDDVTLAGIPAGGIFSGNGVMGGLFSPQQMPAGIFDIIYTYVDSNNCSATDSLEVEVFTETNVNLSGLNTAYCEDAAAVTLTASPAGGTLAGTGISGNQFNPVTAGAGGPYTISYSYTDGFGCLYVEERNVTVNALPQLSIVGLDTLYCSDASPVSLTGNPTGGAFTGDGVSNNTFTPAQAGLGTHVITYTYTSSAGCTNLEKLNVTVEICNSIFDLTELKDIKIYPNPVTNELFIETEFEKTDNLSMVLKDATGKELMTISRQAKASFDVSSLPGGVYFISVTTDGKRTVKKIFVQRN